MKEIIQIRCLIGLTHANSICNREMFVAHRLYDVLILFLG